MRTTLLRLAAICALIMGALTVGVAVSAANTNPNGAQVINIQNQCMPGPFTGGQFCITERAVITNPDESANAAGNTNVAANGSLCFTETDSTGAVVDQVCQNNVHEHILVSKDGNTQEEHLSYTETFTTPSGTECVTVNLHETNNGQIQYENITPC